MLPSLHLRRVQTSLIVFASLTPSLAALQNVTVDDAVLVGTVVPAYLPDQSYWNRGQDCTGCLVQPDPSQAYNGTWHDATYSPGNGYAPSITFSFTGRAIYIFFILANNVPGATTLTNVTFLLDGVPASTFVHQPSASTNFQYNVAVYANDTLPHRQHSMVVEPADTNKNGSNALMLFDYLIYTTNTSSSVSSSAVPSSSPSQTSATGGTSSSPSNAAVIGGVVAGVVVALALIIAFLWYRRFRRRDRYPSPSTEEIIESFPPPDSVAPVFYRDTDTPSPVQEMGNPLSKPASVNRSTMPSPSPPVPSSTSSVFTSSSGSDRPPSNAVHGLLEQVELLRNEVADLRQMRHEEQDAYELEALPPPEYSEQSDDPYRRTR